jgi:hypothetical protein
LAGFRGRSRCSRSITFSLGCRSSCTLSVPLGLRDCNLSLPLGSCSSCDINFGEECIVMVRAVQSC